VSAVPDASSLRDRLRTLLEQAPLDLVRAALVAAEVEHPGLDSGRSIATLDALGSRAAERLRPLAHRSMAERVAALNTLFFEDEGFAGNHAHYDDFRNSLLNVVLDRRLGIPITLALVYMEVARRADIAVRGVAFPGHFLMAVDTPGGVPLIVDPFDRGAVLDDTDCRALLRRHLGESATYTRALLAPCSDRHLLARLLNNLKRAYVEMRSFPHARLVTDLLVSVDPMIVSERRDRGLLAYHLDDYPSALADLEAYLQMTEPAGRSARAEREQLEEHVAMLRRRVAGLN
jgi:regulator of sirC expression with transglutaminase-like and TPR domain